MCPFCPNGGNVDAQGYCANCGNPTGECPICHGIGMHKMTCPGMPPRYAAGANTNPIPPNPRSRYPFPQEGTMPGWKVSQCANCPHKRWLHSDVWKEDTDTSYVDYNGYPPKVKYERVGHCTMSMCDCLRWAGSELDTILDFLAGEW